MEEPNDIEELNQLIATGNFFNPIDEDELIQEIMLSNYSHSRR
jgi:hypothetical protein